MRDKESGKGERLPLKTILTNLFNRVESMEEESFEREFQSLKAFSDELKHSKEYSCSEGEKDVNRKKNRYKDILPFDYSRVTLSEYPGVPGSDYINANYIKGASGSNAYIASQGPLPNTVNDFWRMVVECQVQVIVMACNEQEAGKHKCERYWGPESSDEEEEEEDEDERKSSTEIKKSSEERQYGNYFVKLLKARRICPDFLVRTMRLRWKNDAGIEEEKTVCQFHYSAWPDHGIPTQVKPLLEMVRLIRDCQASETLPVLVHCSAGCGRTGTICAIDFIWGLLRTGKLTSNFCLYDLVKEMRKQRIAIVQTVDQYTLVHRAVRELFLEQLRVIDTHTYENVDGNGLPIFRSNTEESDTDYETVFVNEQNIDKILSEKLSQNLNLSASSSFLDMRLPPKQREFESLNLESRNVGTSTSATTSTANSSDNLLEDFHRDISKSTPKLFEPALPPESVRDTAAPQRFKKGNLRLKQTDDGHWKLEEHEGMLSESKNFKGKKPRKKSNEFSEAPPLLRKPSMKKIKAFFNNKNPPQDISSFFENSKAEEDLSPTPYPTSSHLLSATDIDLSSGSKSVPNSLDRKSIRKVASPQKNSDIDHSSSIEKSVKIKRSKSMKVMNNNSIREDSLSRPVGSKANSFFDGVMRGSSVNLNSPPPKPKRLINHEYANIQFSTSSDSAPELQVKSVSKENSKFNEFREFVANNKITPTVRSPPPKPKRTIPMGHEYANINFSGSEDKTFSLTESLMASFESAEKEGDKIGVFSDTVESSDVNMSFNSFIRNKERRNSFRQAVDTSGQSWSQVPNYENLSSTTEEYSTNSINPYETISYKNSDETMEGKLLQHQQQQSRNLGLHSTNDSSNNILQSVGLVSEILKQKQQSKSIRKHNSNNNTYGINKATPPPPYKQPPSVGLDFPKSSSVNRIPHRHLPSISRLHTSEASSRVPPIHYNQISSPPKLPAKENKILGKNVRRQSKDFATLSPTSMTLLSHDDSYLPDISSYSYNSINISNNSNSKKQTNRRSLGDFANFTMSSGISASSTSPHHSTPNQYSDNTQSPPGIDLDTVAAMMTTGSSRDLAKPLFGRSLAGVLSGAATNLRSRFLGSTSMSSSSSSSDGAFAQKESLHYRSTPSPPSRLNADEPCELSSSSIPLTVPGASCTAARHLGPCGFPDVNPMRSREPPPPPKNFIRKQEYL